MVASRSPKPLVRVRILVGVQNGDIAQLVEHLVEAQGVLSSNLSITTNKCLTLKPKCMVKVFRKVNGEKVDVVEHTLEILKDCPHADIHIGTDSQNIADFTSYSVVIAYRFGGRGVHYITHSTRVPKIMDRWTRLWRETELSIEVAEWLKEKIKVKIQIDLDYNLDEKHFSSKLVQASKGWAQSLGYEVNLKPDMQVATRAADYQCR